MSGQVKRQYDGPALVNALTAAKVKLGKIDNIAADFIALDPDADTAFNRCMRRIREYCK